MASFAELELAKGAGVLDYHTQTGHEVRRTTYASSTRVKCHPRNTAVANVSHQTLSYFPSMRICGNKTVWRQKNVIVKLSQLEMWANAQRDGRPAEYRWRPLFNAAKFG